MKIGLQLYSVRDALGADLDGGLAKLSDIGYQYVETAGHYGLTAAELKSKFDTHGLKAISAHVGLGEIEANAAQVIEEAKTLGLTCVVVPWVDKNAYQGKWHDLADSLVGAADLLAKSGLSLAYHNHEFEFVADGDELPEQILIEHTDPKMVGFEIDIAWVQAAGEDPVKWFGMIEGFAKFAHFKDVDADGKLADLGKGVVAWDDVIAACKKAGVEYAIAEHDHPSDPMVFAQQAFDFLMAKGFQA